ncbi:hypothetical protein Scep_027976 [Stephania cephalantha]|uniref:Polyprotein n=1 Tax=Stephania cephalantha TaxID=152367 RepID=A0AAP0E914_9MAGN
MFIKTNITASIRGTVEKYDKVHPLLKAIEDQFQTSDKALARTLIMQFSSLRMTGVKGVREHIMRMRDIAARLKTLEVDMSESFLVHYILNTLPSQYAPFKISYNTHRDKWSINELTTMCVQEEGRLDYGARREWCVLTVDKKKKDKRANWKGKDKMQPQGGIMKKESKCFFHKKKGHMKKDCIKFQQWLQKKGYDKS